MKRLIVSILGILLSFSIVFGQRKPYKIDHTTVRVGKIKTYQVAQAQFVLTNTSREPFAIKSALGSCGCVKVYYSRKTILPGKSDTIYVSFRPYMPGRFVKGAIIDLDINPPYNKIYLKIKGKAVPNH